MKKNYTLKILSLLFVGVLGSSAFGQYNFTNAGATGDQGPTQGDVNTAYTGTSLDGQVTVNTQGIQEWTVPATGTYLIEAWGAEGGHSVYGGGLGSFISGEFNLTAGQTLFIVVGQQGGIESGNVNRSGGGGGGSFVYEGSTLYIAAGGGGGKTGYTSGAYNFPSVESVTITDANDGSGWSDGSGGAGGSGGNGGAGSAYGGAGAGWLTNGGDATNYTDNQGGTSAAGGWIGGIPPAGGGLGGFGGGGAGGIAYGGGGGGGGYSGGGGGTDPGSGGGGSSYNSGANPMATAAINNGHGYITITPTCDQLTVTATADTVCQFGALTLTAVSSNGGTITWDNGVSNGVEFYPDTAGTFTYNATSDNGNDCGYSIDIVVLPSPIFSLTATDELYMNDGTITLSLEGGLFPFAYDWDNDGTGDFDDPQNLSDLAAGTYTVVVMHDNGCTATESITVDSQVSIDETNLSTITVYPNPIANGQFKIQSNEFIQEIIAIDMLGRTISLEVDGNNMVKVSHLTAGNYTIRILSESEIFTSQVVITE